MGIRAALANTRKEHREEPEIYRRTLKFSVMRRYIEAGQADAPKVDVYEKLAGMSKGFRKALDRAGEGAPSAA